MFDSNFKVIALTSQTHGLKSNITSTDLVILSNCMSLSCFDTLLILMVLNAKRMLHCRRMKKISNISCSYFN